MKLIKKIKSLFKRKKKNLVTAENVCPFGYSSSEIPTIDNDAIHDDPAYNGHPV